MHGCWEKKHQESQYATCQSCRTEPEDIHAPQRPFPTEAIHGKEQGHRETKPGTKVWREPFSAGLFFLHGFDQEAFPGNQRGVYVRSESDICVCVRSFCNRKGTNCIVRPADVVGRPGFPGRGPSPGATRDALRYIGRWSSRKVCPVGVSMSRTVIHSAKYGFLHLVPRTGGAIVVEEIVAVDAVFPDDSSPPAGLRGVPFPPDSG